MIYRITKRIEIASSHWLNLNYDSKCSNNHGHNWIIDITCQSTELDSNGMVMDFQKIKELIQSPLDHKCLNDIISQPTAENIAAFILDLVPQCVKVRVQESANNWCEVEL